MTRLLEIASYLGGALPCLIFLIALLSGCAATGHYTTPLERLCGADALCRSEVLLAPRAAYPDPETAIAAGLAWAAEAHPHREVILYPYREGEHIRLRIDLAGRTDGTATVLPGDLAVAHTHPLPTLRRCSATDRLAAAELPVPLYVQHTRGEIVRCEPFTLAGRRVER